MKKSKVLMSFMLSGILSFNVFADTDSTLQVLKYKTKAMGNEISASINDTKANINEKLNNKDEASSDRKSAFEDRVYATGDKLEAEKYKVKGKIIDAWNGDKATKIKDNSEGVWSEVKEKTANGWSATKKGAAKMQEKTTEKYKDLTDN